MFFTSERLAQLELERIIHETFVPRQLRRVWTRGKRRFRHVYIVDLCRAAKSSFDEADSSSWPSEQNLLNFHSRVRTTTETVFDCPPGVGMCGATFSGDDDRSHGSRRTHTSQLERACDSSRPLRSYSPPQQFEPMFQAGELTGTFQLSGMWERWGSALLVTQGFLSKVKYLRTRSTGPPYG